MKKILLVMCVCAILLTGTACKKKSNAPAPGEDSGDIVGMPVTEETKPRETIDIDGDGKSDGYVVEGIEGYDPSEVHTDDETGPATDGNGDTEGSSGAEDPDTPVQNTADETTPAIVISDGGSEKGLWPTDSLPKDVPAFEDYKEMYPTQYADGESAEEWYLSFDSTEKDYEDWLEKLKAEGYVESDKIVGFWGNGEQILNLYTEEIDGEFCVSVDIFKSKPVEYPEAVSKVFPAFSVSDSTLYGWYVKGNKLSVSYACGKSFASDLEAYKKKLTEAGFTVTGDSATKEVDGKTYTVRYGDSVSKYEDSLEFTY
ncbi:MAG: hypothetical protein IJA55_04705 [Clostridia bacterium]|nr:hypothetical protein [Clostridia bacterium]